MVLSNPGTQYMSLSAGIAQEPVSMTPRLTAETILLCACANIGVTVDGKVVVGRRLHHRAGVHRHRPHKARAALCDLSGQRHGRWWWCRIWAASSAGRRRRPIFFNHMYHRITQMSI